MSEEGNAIAGTRKQVFGIYSWESAYEHGGVGWLMLSCVDTLHTDNESLRAVNKQLIAKCRNQRA